MDDLISRQMAIKEAVPVQCEGEVFMMVQLETLEGLPSVQPDLSEYSDKLWKAAYERGRAEAQAERKTGKWTKHPEVKNVYGGTYIECSQCGEKYVVQHMEDEKYCRNCGARMEE